MIVGEGFNLRGCEDKIAKSRSRRLTAPQYQMVLCLLGTPPPIHVSTSFSRMRGVIDAIHSSLFLPPGSGEGVALSRDYRPGPPREPTAHGARVHIRVSTVRGSDGKGTTPYSSQHIPRPPPLLSQRRNMIRCGTHALSLSQCGRFSL